MKQAELMDSITKQILEDMERGVMPWQKPWVAQGNFPKNATSSKYYRGVNVFWLSSVAEKKGYKNNLWLTYNQAREAGGHVREGEKATDVIFFKPLSIREEDEEGNYEEKRIRLLKSFKVFNLDQVEGLDHLKTEAPVKNFIPNVEAERIIRDSRADFAEVIIDRAYYSPCEDFIRVPHRSSFASEENYYSTVFHELTHWTGSQKRLKRNLGTAFGTPEYAFEELVAEMGGAFLAGFVGYQYDTQHSSYVASWTKKLKEDSRAIFRAAALAQNAADYLLGLGVKEAASV